MHPPSRADLLSLRGTGEMEERIRFALRIGNHRANPRLLGDARQRLHGARRLKHDDLTRSAAVTPPPAWRGMPTTGVRKTFTLLIDFWDHRHLNDPGAIHQTIYGRGGIGAPYDSVAAYYDRASYGQLDLYAGTTFPWYRTTYPRTLIEQSDHGRDRLIKEALEYFHARGHDFAQYDTDGDGVVDFFQVLWAGPDTRWGSFWWPYQAGFSDESFTLDNVQFGAYAWMWESQPPGRPFDTATAIHETGHALGLPDYYDYDRAKGPRGGVGGLDMMDGARHDHNCFSKYLLDWVRPRIVARGSESITLGPSGRVGDCVLVWPRAGRMPLFSEFFMVQNRERVGNDLDLPGEGLVIWHVDSRLEGDDFACDNATTPRKLLRLMEADGAEEIEAGGLADAEDFYRVGAAFGADTVPPSKGYRRRSGVEVKAIARQEGALSATYAVVTGRRP